MIRPCARCGILLLLIAVLAGCGTFGRGGRGDGDDRRGPNEAREPRMGEVTRLTVNDQLYLRLTEARLALQLAPAQMPAWDAYQSKAVEFIGDAERHTGVAGDGAAPAQFDRRISAEQQRTAALVQLAAQAKKLYAALNDTQRRTADRLLVSTLPLGALAVPPAPRADAR
jgi:hypothetical protein